MQSVRGTPQPGFGAAAAPALDVHAAAALERLTSWAAKALRATAAVVTLADGEQTIVASATGAEAGATSERLRDFAGDVVRAGQPRAISELTALVADGSGTDGAAAFLGAPLLDREGTAVGSFCVMDAKRRPWTIQDIELVSELTSSAMTEVDLHAARAEAERERLWSDRQQAVLELIAARAPLGRTLSELLRAAESYSPGMLAVICLVERARGGPASLRVLAGHGVPRGFTVALDGLAAVEGASVCSTAVARREPVAIPDVTDAGLSPSFVALAGQHGLRAGWATPILSRGGTVLGTFTIYDRRVSGPRPHDQVVVDRSAHLARLAIEQVRGAEALRRNATRAQSLAREQTALQRVATRVAGETDPEALFSLVAEQVGRLLKAEAGYVLRFEDERAYRNMGSWTRGGEPGLPVGELADHPDDGICAQLRRGRGARRDTVEPAADRLGFAYRIAAPIVVDGRSWGMVLALRDADEFRREDEKRLARFAQLASVAVANAQAREALATQALTDPLTLLANRRAFDERLAEETDRANRHARALSVMLVDVDHFKAINDRFGHATGDRVLVNLADSLRAVMRGGDLLARIGGDEMAMILPDCALEQAAQVAERMLAAVRADSALARRHGVTLSAGVAGLATGQSADHLLRCADQALYAAKNEGRNRVASYEPDMPDRSGLRLGA